jgi:formylmethanofuran dehydrogenase subunit C
MPLTLRLKIESRLPIDVRHLSAAVNDGLGSREVTQLKALVGKRPKSIGDLFEISGDLSTDRRLELSGKLAGVHRIGHGLATGSIVIQSDAGRHVGTSMSGGQITVHGNVGDYLGAQMTGGAVRVTGNAGDFVAAALEGAKYGMNRGEILIQGNAGVALGKRMRRGMIIVGGDVGELAAWNMLAGTIVVLGRSAEKTATDIKRGTLILAGDAAESKSDAAGKQPQRKTLGPAFTAGGTSQPQIVQFLGTWLKRHYPQTLSSAVQDKLLGRSFVKYNGVELNQNRAEIFVAV